MQTEIILGRNPDQVADIPQSGDAQNTITGEKLTEDAPRTDSTITMRDNAPVVKQAEAVDVRPTSIKAVACDDPGYEDYLKRLYNVPEGGEVSGIQRIFAGLAQELHDITQGSIDRKYNVVGGVSESRSKSANARSKMLKMIMPELSRDMGDKLSKAVGDNDGDAVAMLMAQIGRKLQKKLNMKNRK